MFESISGFQLFLISAFIFFMMWRMGGGQDVRGGQKGFWSMVFDSMAEGMDTARGHKEQDFRRIGEFCAIDVETTGLDPNKDRIVSIGLVAGEMPYKQVGKIHTKTLEAEFNPGVPVSAQAAAVHGMTDESLRDKGSFDASAKAIREFIGSRVLIGHNVMFDVVFLNAALHRAGVKQVTAPTYCTLKKMSAWHVKLGNRFRRFSLDDTAEALGVERKGKAHTALSDAMLSLQIAVQFRFMRVDDLMET